ncbi:tetratricopeptide repeat protein [Streptomyces sp. NBC_00663]|uniref:tetratricopeptide repeat protein n=1 Tax=Streptomyces sp. NBC_00663 TaxID=2975801 RepID=UPI002E33B0A6|nr:tetratricopeptide repeat protein [Streptomyces sp. NBC_00663]
MSRLGREKREQQGAVLAAAPLDVLVGPGGATVGGVPVGAVPGEEIQQTVLNHLHRIALATGHPVHATVRDERIGYVVALLIERDGSSQFTAEPRRTAPPAGVGETAWPTAAGQEELPPPPMTSATPPTPPAAPAAPAHVADTPPTAPGPAPAPTADAPLTAPAPADAAGDHPPRDKPTHLLRAPSEPATFPLRSVPESAAQEPRDAVPTFRLRAVPEWVEKAAPGTVAPPTGQFGPPPVMDAPTAQAQPARATPAPKSPPKPPVLDLAVAALDDPDPKPTPPRGFDAVAEAVLGDDPATAYDGGGTAMLAEPMARINDAVKEGRVEEAARLSEQTVTQASAALGAEHPEVLRLLELTAYIAYLAGDPARAFGISLDLARTRSRARDAEAAYGNVQSAATAWRAVRDPELGLRMGVDLIGLWTELTHEDGPAAEDIEQLESAHARMNRLAERARKLSQ